MVTDFSLISHGFAALSSLLLAVLIGRKYLRRYTDRALFLAAIASSVWASIIVLQSLTGQPSFFIRYLSELLRDVAWILVLFALLRAASQKGALFVRLRKGLGVVLGLLVTVLFVTSVAEEISGFSILGGKLKVMGSLALSLLGISLVEQIWRNSADFGRSSVKYICIGVLTLFTYDFFMYVDALLFGTVSEAFWSARGAVNAAIVPLFAISMVNSLKQPVSFQLSRSAVFHVGTIVVAGIYLIFTALGGYYVRAFGGEWGEALQVLFLTVFLAMFTGLLTSSRFRARLMIFISQNFFDYKYDYREEWLKMTRQLADLSDDPPLPVRIVRIIGGLVESDSGLLWVRDEDDNYVLSGAVNCASPRHPTIDGESDLVRFLSEREWIIDMDEYRSDPVRYSLLEIPDPISDVRNSWLIIPMYLDNELYAITLIGKPYAPVALNWENFDLVRVVARQMCNLLAQADAQNRLSRAMQFEAVSKASAFMVHDLKTLIAQLSLLVNNASRHRNNPAFIDDMIRTTEHSVRKMSSLVDHFRKPVDSLDNNQPVDISRVIRELCQHFSRAQPAPQVDALQDGILISANAEQLKSVIGHVIQNAIDATPPDGEVTLTLKVAAENAVLFIQDSGTGMTDEFIRAHLFKPFDSTKGLTGMGIGAYQAREYVRKLGGSVDVTSKPGLGSCFTLRFPLATEEESHEEDPDIEEGPDRASQSNAS